MNQHPLTGYTRIAVLVLTLAILEGCGKTGPLYLPDKAGEVVTRPGATPPEADSSTAPNSPQTPDSQPAAPPPAPEVTDEESKKEKGASPPPPR